MMKERENSRESEGKQVDEENNFKDNLSDEKSKYNENPDDKLVSKERASLGESSEKKMRNFDSSAVCESKGAGGSSGFQELTLSYLCDNSKDGVPAKTLLNSFEKMGCNSNSNYKGKGIAVSEDQNDENNRWIERDFLRLNENSRVNSCKRDVEEMLEKDVENRDKKQKMETLNLSLALPDVSLSMAGSNRVQNGDPPFQNGDFPARLRSNTNTRSVQSVEPSDNNTRTTYSNDFTAASMSYSCSHPFSHNPSCSLTRNSTENFDYSGSHRRDDQIWNAGEGTNGSVHSRFRPVGDGTVAFSNNGSGSFAFANRLGSDAGKNSMYGAPSSDSHSFFPSELPARPRMETQLGDSRGRGSESFRGLEALEGGRARKLSRPERILREIVSESIAVMAQIIQDLPEETLSSTKEYLKNLISKQERKDELMGLQNRLQRRSDLTAENLSKAHKNQLDILVAIKMGLGAYLSSKISLPCSELVEIFLLERCRNINCKRMLPVEDCDCKICSTKKGFCSECMCPVCLNFDSAANTCSWVGCDVCSHWCHATCGIEKTLIRPGPSLKGPSGTTEMQFNCLGCSHASEMYGFVKDVFLACARDWSLDNLIKELDCVSKIFRASEDLKGKEFYVKANDMLAKLHNKIMSPSDVCRSIFQFFSYTDGFSDFTPSSVPSKDTTMQATLRNEPSPVPISIPVVPKPPVYEMSSSSGRKDYKPVELFQNGMRASTMSDKMIEDEWSVKLSKKDGFDSLESIVRVKEVEARMFQNRADDARREAESFKRMIRMETEKLEAEYNEKLGKLCLQETEEKKIEKLDELKVLEESRCDYYKMKMRMQADIAGLLKRMEATKQQWV